MARGCVPGDCSCPGGTGGQSRARRGGMHPLGWCVGRMPGGWERHRPGIRDQMQVPGGGRASGPVSGLAGRRAGAARWQAGSAVALRPRCRPSGYRRPARSWLLCSPPVPASPSRRCVATLSGSGQPLGCQGHPAPCSVSLGGEACLGLALRGGWVLAGRRHVPQGSTVPPRHPGGNRVPGAGGLCPYPVRTPSKSHCPGKVCRKRDGRFISLPE